MPQQVFVKVVGFSDVERHALDAVLRLSRERPTNYLLWAEGATAMPALALLDGQSNEARLEAGKPNGGMKLVWVGEDPPAGVWRTFSRPVSWADVVSAMDEEFASHASVEFDLDLTGVQDEPATLPPDEVPEEPVPRRALIANADLAERLYLRAKLALNHMTIADEAETAAQALELVRARKYMLALVDMGLPGGDGWEFVRRLTKGDAPIPHVIVTQQQPSLGERLRARFAGVDALMRKPPDPERLQELLQKLH
ncbi:MAG TPA: response regulator [Ramlibacter sp.]|uniref:response regulator n=1 Tax=Ramlibacter sp. TaxID=1917967 RepID=UPI002CB246E4|nr:response regulator [Ramlibacter sp.]HVZ43733.1 response regulator [Ramlibacter sp.]